MSLLDTMLKHRHSAFVWHLSFWFVVVLACSYLDRTQLLVYLLSFIVLDLWLALCLGFMLRLPVHRSDQPSPEGWEWEEHVVMRYPVRWLMKSFDATKPLVILIHGWNSRAANMTGRSELYERLGYNCILFEMRAHGGNKRVSNWAALHVCHDLEEVLKVFNDRGWLDNGFVLHGHSLGGFVAQRVLRPELETSKNARGMILESPVTSYEYINNQTCEYLKIPSFLHHAMMHRLLRYYNKLNPPVFQVNDVGDLATPNWGLPVCPTLLVQAKFDATLGKIHSELLIDVHSKIDTDFTFHITDKLQHAYESKNSHRDMLIEEWMREKSLFFS